MARRARRLAAALQREPRMLAYRVRRRGAVTVVSLAPRVRLFETLLPRELTQWARLAANREIAVHRGRYVLATQQQAVTVWHLAAQTADAVAGALDTGGVQFFAMHLPNTRLTRWGVRRDQLESLAKVLSNELGAQGYYYSLGRSEPVRLVRAGLTPEHLSDLSEFRVFRFIRCRTTGKLYGAGEGCRIAVWDQEEDRDTLVAPHHDSLIQEIERSGPLQLEYRRRWDGHAEPVLPGTTQDASAIDFPIDAVYLWVDDADPHWRQKRAEVMRRLGMADASSPVHETWGEHRFRDRGELRASLRSLEMHAPWIRQIYLVTDNQRPDWLDATSDRVTVLDHRDIFEDVTVLPSYNSHAIESQIHRIPGLSQRYLLMNDDVMFNSVVTPYDFFTPTGELRIFFSHSRRPDIAPGWQTTLELARSNSARLLQRDFGRRASHLFSHAPFPQRKDVARDVAARYATEIAETTRSPFRSGSDVVVNSWLHLYTALFTGRGVHSSIRHGYFNVGSAAVRARMEGLAAVRRRYQVICLNDVPPPEGEEDADPGWLSAWLDQMFPIPASFENAGNGDRG